MHNYLFILDNDVFIRGRSLKVFAGHDATEAFLSYHRCCSLALTMFDYVIDFPTIFARREFPHERYAKLLVEDGSGKAEPLKKPESDKEFLELCRLVEQVSYRVKLNSSINKTIVFLQLGSSSLEIICSFSLLCQSRSPFIVECRLRGI